MGLSNAKNLLSRSGKVANKRVENTIDKGGVALSFICLIHCLATPLLALSVLPATFFIGHERFHFYMLIFVLPVAVAAFVRGFFVHRKWLPLCLGFLGSLLLIVAVTFVHDTAVASPFNLELSLTLLGSMFLILAHTANIYTSSTMSRHQSCKS